MLKNDKKKTFTNDFNDLKTKVITKNIIAETKEDKQSIKEYNMQYSKLNDSQDTSLNKTIKTKENLSKEDVNTLNLKQTVVLNTSVEHKSKTDLNELNKYEDLDCIDLTAFREIIRIAKGKLTVQDFCKKCGIHLSFLRTSIKENYQYYDTKIPSDAILRAIALHAENGVTYEELKLSLSGKVYAGRNFSYKSDPDKIIMLLKKAMNNMSISQFSFSNKISRRVISLILNKKIDAVTPKIIEKISLSLTAADREELYEAFGYPNENNSFLSKENKTIVSIKNKLYKTKKRTTTTSISNVGINAINSLAKKENEHCVKEFERISDIRWNIFKKDIFNGFFNYYNYQQINEVVPMSRADYWDLREDDKTQIKMSYQKYKKYIIKLTSLPLCKQTAAEMLTYLRLDDELVTPQWKYRNYLDIVFVNETKQAISAKTGLSLNTVNAFRYKISDKTIHTLSEIYKNISEQELLKYASDAGVLLYYNNRYNKISVKNRKRKNRFVKRTT